MSEFADADSRIYAWDQDYTADEFIGVLGTLSEYRLLEQGPRERILGAVAETIQAHGQTFTMPMATLLCTARAM